MPSTAWDAVFPLVHTQIHELLHGNEGLKTSCEGVPASQDICVNRYGVIKTWKTLENRKVLGGERKTGRKSRVNSLRRHGKSHSKNASRMSNYLLLSLSLPFCLLESNRSDKQKILMRWQKVVLSVLPSLPILY